MRRPASALLLPLALSACNFAASGSEPEAEATSAAAAEPTPVATATPDANTLTPTGWGPLRIGMTRAEVVEALGPDANPQNVGGAEPEQCDQFRPQRAPENMLLMIEEGKLTRIELRGSNDIHTPEGFTVGDAASAIKAKLGTRLSAQPHKYLDAPAEYLTVWQTDVTPGEGGYVDDPEARGIVYEIGADGLVDNIFAGGPAIQYVEGCA